jgi:alanine racemase
MRGPGFDTLSRRMARPSRDPRSTVACIDRAALRANYAEALRHAGGRALIAVVKADAYGHGAVLVARTLAEAGCRRFAVVTVCEAAELRDAGIDEPILLLGGVTDREQAREALARGVTPVVHGERDVDLLVSSTDRARTRAAVHVEIDSGMHRMGVGPDDAVALLQRIAGEPSLQLAGCFTHLARADEPDLAPSFEQIRCFREVLREVRRRGIAPGEVHVANSAALLVGNPLRTALPEATAVRPGVMLYGVRPAPHLAANLRPVMTLETRVQLVRSVRAGEGVGYAALYRPKHDTRIATLPAGYADGVPISASNRGEVLIGARRFPIAGRVSMDSITVDVGDADVAVGDQAILFGAGERGALPVEEAAAAADTLAYELLVRVGSRVPRVAVG